jgi:hypothetical protein
MVITETEPYCYTKPYLPKYWNRIYRTKLTILTKRATGLAIAAPVPGLTWTHGITHRLGPTQPGARARSWGWSIRRSRPSRRRSPWRVELVQGCSSRLLELCGSYNFQKHYTIILKKHNGGCTGLRSVFLMCKIFLQVHMAQSHPSIGPVLQRRSSPS